MAETAPSRHLQLRERGIILLAVTGITILSWLYLLQLGQGGAGAAMPMTRHWTASTASLTLLMWVVMMVGMMLPSATPMISTYAALQRRKTDAMQRLVPTLLFAFGYLLVWTAFSVLATALQWALDRMMLLSPGLAIGARFGGPLFLLAGMYQLTPFKEACLHHCRSPFAFLFNQWRDGWSGALKMGIEHGAYCLGCCWLLMALLFAVGVMNLLWVAALTLVVFCEKLLRPGAWIARIGGVAMAGYGVWLLVQA